jgi:hypothetical protein
MSEESARLLKALGNEVEAAEAAGLFVSFGLRVDRRTGHPEEGWAINLEAFRPAPPGTYPVTAFPQFRGQLAPE